MVELDTYDMYLAPRCIVRYIRNTPRGISKSVLKFYYTYIYKVYWEHIKVILRGLNIKSLLRLFEKYIKVFYPSIKGILNYIVNCINLISNQVGR